MPWRPAPMNICSSRLMARRSRPSSSKLASQSEAPMAPEDFRFLTRLLRRRSGLALSPNKRALTKSRLAPLVRRFGFKDEAGLIQDLRLGREALADAVVEAMTVQESGIF